MAPQRPLSVGLGKEVAQPSLPSRRWLCAIILGMVCLGLSPLARGQQGETTSKRSQASIPKRSASEVLSLRLVPPVIRYDKAESYGSYVGAGAVVLIDGNHTVGALKISNSPISLSGKKRSTDTQEIDAPSIEMRIAGRKIYFDHPVELFVATDVTGRRIITVQNTHEVSLQGLQSGVYILRCVYRGTPTVIKAIVK